MWRQLIATLRHCACPKLIVLSLVLTAITMAIWLRSYLAHDRFVWHVGSDSWGIVNCNGQLQVKDMQAVSLPTGYRQLRGFWNGDELGNWEEDGVVTRNARVFGLGWHNGGVPFQGSWGRLEPPPRFAFQYWTFTLPHRVIVVLLLLMPACGLFRFKNWPKWRG